MDGNTTFRMLRFHSKAKKDRKMHEALRFRVSLQAEETSQVRDALNEQGGDIKRLHQDALSSYRNVSFVAAVPIVYSVLNKMGWLSVGDISPTDFTVGFSPVVLAMLISAMIESRKASNAQFWFLVKCIDRPLVGEAHVEAE